MTTWPEPVIVPEGQGFNGFFPLVFIAKDRKTGMYLQWTPGKFPRETRILGTVYARLHGRMVLTFNKDYAVRPSALLDLLEVDAPVDWLDSGVGGRPVFTYEVDEFIRTHLISEEEE